MPFDGFSLQRKIALITGFGRGLGLEAAKGLAAGGTCVLLNGGECIPRYPSPSRGGNALLNVK
jgi:hypothetical protein